ncbi:unnamed protein product [Auanema sp. JU1783]|nr:unnamed protein product [Auanema sp. JU1783]
MLSSDSSDTEPIKKVERRYSSDDEGEKLTVPALPEKKSDHQDSGSEYDLELSDSEKDPTSSSRKRPAMMKKTPIKRKKQETTTKEDENRYLFDTEDQFRTWTNMSEKDREQRIFELMEQREITTKREEITLKLKAQSGDSVHPVKSKIVTTDDKKQPGSDSSDEDEAPKPVKGSSDSEIDADFHRPSEVDKKRRQKSAMADLLQKRKEKEKKKGIALSIDDVFGKPKDGGSDSSSSSESSSNSSRSSSSSRSPSPARRHSEDEREAESKKPIDTKDELIRARLSRFKLSKIVHAPFFGEVVKGCFVRIQTGPIPGSKSKYRIAKVLDVVQTAKVYSLEGTKTNKGLKLKWGKHERVYRLEYVSNTEFPDDEYHEWKEITAQEDIMPTIEHIQKKFKEIAKAMNHSFTSAEIDLMLKEKGRFTKAPKNYALSKGELMKKKEYAEQCGNLRDAQKLQREIEELDSKAEQLDKARSADISGITWINQRNRNKMKQAFLGNEIHVDMTTGDDPFTRKKERMKVVSSSGRKEKSDVNPKDDDEDDLPPGAEEKPKVSSATHSAAPAQAPSTSSSTMKSSFMPSLSSSSRTSKSSNDLFNLHRQINQIELDIDLNKLTATRDTLPGRLDDFDAGIMRAPTAMPADNRRMVSLDDYRKRKAACFGRGKMS